MSKMYWQLIEDLGVQPGPSGLDIPELKENAADEEIIAAVRRLDSARASLRQKRALLRNNSGKLIESLMEEC